MITDYSVFNVLASRKLKAYHLESVTYLIDSRRKVLNNLTNVNIPVKLVGQFLPTYVIDTASYCKVLCYQTAYECQLLFRLLKSYP